ncbi:RTA1-domain-containing protein, partial [Hysterangium stoloniferum]
TFYGYIPTNWICLTFLILFGATTIAHVWQSVFLRSRMFWILPTIVLCGIGELIGWSGRYWSSQNPVNQNAFTIQIVSTIFAPVFLTAAMYNILGKLINIMGEQYSRIAPKTYLKIFITADVLCLLVQSGGGGIASGTSDSAVHLGSKIMLVGIILQLITLLFYMALGVEFIIRVYRNKPLIKKSHMSQAVDIEQTRKSNNDNRVPHNVHLMIIGLSISTILVLIRSVYRTAELADGFKGPILRTQVYFNTLDATPIVLALLTLNAFSPTILLRPVNDPGMPV